MIYLVRDWSDPNWLHYTMGASFSFLIAILMKRQLRREDAQIQIHAFPF